MRQIITPTSINQHHNLWQYRELFYFLVWRNIKTRYKQTVIGISWVILQPLISMVVFSFLFGTIAKIDSEGIPYPIFVYTGLLFWNLFSRSVISASQSVTSNQNLINNVNFPKIILPITTVFVNLVDFFFATIILAWLMVFYQFLPQLSGLLIVPLSLAAILMLSIGIGAILASLNVFYRDISYLTSYAVQVVMFLTPVVYPIKVLNQKYKYIIMLNPLTGIITALRSQILGTKSESFYLFSISIVVCAIVFIFGVKYFQKKETQFVDRI